MRNEQLIRVSRFSAARVRAALESLEPRTLMAAVEWVGGSQGNWNDAANWSGGAVPGADDDVHIDGQAGQPSVALDTGTHTIQSLLVDDATFTVSGGALTLSDGGTLTYGSVLNLAGGTL